MSASEPERKYKMRKILVIGLFLITGIVNAQTTSQNNESIIKLCDIIYEILDEPCSSEYSPVIAASYFAIIYIMMFEYVPFSEKAIEQIKILTASAGIEYRDEVLKILKDGPEIERVKISKLEPVALQIFFADLACQNIFGNRDMGWVMSINNFMTLYMMNRSLILARKL